MSPEIDTTNKFLVSANSRGVIVMNPPRGPISQADALLLAAYLVALAPVVAPDGDMSDEPVTLQFTRVLQAVQNT